MSQARDPSQAGVARPTGAIWTRALWMRLGALNGLVSLCILLLAGAPLFAPEAAAAIRLGAQVQFMHGMATLACATFMNIGATAARLAPAFFLGGAVLYCLPTYAIALGLPAPLMLAQAAGLGALATGWAILAWSARDIDKAS